MIFLKIIFNKSKVESETVKLLNMIEINEESELIDNNSLIPAAKGYPNSETQTKTLKVCL